MFLKRIELLGFKSFADRTVIEFTDGITALLGPNGCGKSNIVDAVKWVLGEQSVRNMRADKMEDVIFSGTENRKAMSVAEVTLVIANEQDILEIDRPEIAIKRRIFRDGDSEYFLNGAPVRLKEIRELFFDTGVGKSAYSVMEQGRIDQLLSTKPEERRYIFEEAAGITKFKVRGSEAERKLARTQENMGQVENILHEVRRNYETLKRQTEKTLEYRRLKEAIFNLDRDLKLIQWRDLEKARDKKKSRLEAGEDKYRGVLEAITKIKTTLAGELDAVNVMETRLIESQKRLYGTDLEKENQEEQIRSLRERRYEIEEMIESAKSREKNAIDSLNGVNEIKKKREDDLAGFQERLKEIQGNIETYQKSIDSVEERIKGNTHETDKTNKDLAAEEKRRDELQDEVRRITDDIVVQLDRGLKESGFDRNARRSLETAILELLNETRIRAEGRSRLLLDRMNLSDIDDGGEIIKGAAEDFSVLKDSLDRLTDLFGDYRSSGAAFLDEFLAPEGIITKKRDLDEKITGCGDGIRKLKEGLFALADEKETLFRQLDEARESLEELRVAHARTTTQVAGIQDSLKSLDREVESEVARLDEIRRQLTTEETRIHNLDQQVEVIQTKGKELDRRQDELRKDMAGLELGISSENKKMANRETELKDLTEKRGNLEITREKLRLEMEHLDGEIKLLLEDFRDRNSRDLGEFLQCKDSIDKTPKQLREALSNTKTALKGLGPVNLMAPEEYVEVSERFDFLVNQLEDLRKARENLAQVTEEIRRESALLFMKTYKEIRDSFHEMFRRLFGGGRGEIRLMDYDDPLNSGLEIYAQPPGKKLESISLLSGGERSLCGVALMFATFLVKPSPFCILDEIDAALDEANIQRFVNVLLEFGRTGQFVVITHNKKTVAGARSLLGITMQESGVSRLITLKLDGEEQVSGDEESTAAG